MAPRTRPTSSPWSPCTREWPMAAPTTTSTRITALQSLNGCRTQSLLTTMATAFTGGQRTWTVTASHTTCIRPRPSPARSSPTSPHSSSATSTSTGTATTARSTSPTTRTLKVSSSSSSLPSARPHPLPARCPLAHFPRRAGRSATSYGVAQAVPVRGPWRPAVSW